MEWDEQFEVKQKTKFWISIGCFFGIVLLVMALLAGVVWYAVSSHETIVLKSESPDRENTVEIVQTDDFPDPVILIKYGDQEIEKFTIPDQVSVEWINDNEAVVLFEKRGREPETVTVTF